MSATTVTKDVDKSEAAPTGSTPGMRSTLRRLAGGGWRRTLLLAAAVLAVLALIAYVVIAAMATHTRSVVESQRGAAEQAARASVERLLSYDSADLAPTRTAIDETSTGAFHDQFVTVFTDIVTPNATAQRAKSAAVVRESGVVSAEEGRVVVLLFLNQSTSSSQLPADRIDTIQTRVTMADVDGRWLVSALDQV